jgi:hypothetical protein
LLGIENDQQVALQQQNITSIAGGMQAVVMQQQMRREFQVDEEAVAAILANQLANEDTSPHANMPYSRTGLVLILSLIMFNLVSYDAVNRNKVFNTSTLPFYFFFLLTTCFGPYRPSSSEIYN